MPFCTCMRLAACCTTTLCGPSITSSVTSSPRRAGQAVHEERALLGVGHQPGVHLVGAKSARRTSRSASWPMLAQTSV